MNQALSTRARPARPAAAPRDTGAMAALAAARADLEDASRDLAALLTRPASSVVRVQSQQES